jgi:hypothetical protein
MIWAQDSDISFIVNVFTSAKIGVAGTLEMMVFMPIDTLTFRG